MEKIQKLVMQEVHNGRARDTRCAVFASLVSSGVLFLEMSEFVQSPQRYAYRYTISSLF